MNEYRNIDACNQSLLVALSKGIGTFNKVANEQISGRYWEDDPDHFIIGNLVDTLLCFPENIDDIYYISSMASKPSDTIMSIIKQLYDQYGDCDTCLDDYKDQLIAIGREHNYQNTYKDDTLFATIKKSGEEYWNELCKSANKKILSEEEFILATDMVNTVKTHVHTREYFVDKDEKITSYHQVMLHGHIQIGDMEFPVKGLIDRIDVSETDTEVLVSLIDYKTIGDTTKMFESSFFKRRYDIQASFYRMLAIHFAKDLEFLKTTGKKIVINPIFTFIVMSKSNIECPLVYEFDVEYNNDFVHRGYVKNDRLYKGINELLVDYNWHVNNGIWHVDRETYESNGKYEIYLDGNST